MQLCVGRLPFLVCAPYFHHFFTSDGLKSRYFFYDGVPSSLNGLLSQGKIHLAPSSSFNYGLYPEKFVLYSELCTSCHLEVYSVRLYSYEPLENLGGELVHLTSHSATSVALLKVLFSLRYKIEPRYVEGRPFDSQKDKARLLIGDEALLQNQKKEFPFVYDLGSLWKEWQGMPFVFGAWSIHRSALQGHLLQELTEFLSEIKQSVDNFRESPKEALLRWMDHYPVNLPIEDLRDYYNSLDYTFTDQRKQSLSLFFEKCFEIGLLPSLPEIHYWAP